MMCLRWALLVGLVLLQPGCVLFAPGGSAAKLRQEAALLPAVESARACQAVAETLTAQGHLEQAVDQLLKAREYDPRADVSPALARLYARLGKDTRALDEFARAVEAHPKDADLWNDLGYYHYQRGNWAQAEENLRRALAVSPKHSKAWTNLGLTLGQMEKYPEALDAFEKAVRPGEARCNLAFVLMTQGKHAQAEEMYHEALKTDPGLTLARNALARLAASRADKH